MARKRQTKEDLRREVEELQARLAALESEAEEIRRLANFPRSNPNPVLEVDAEGQVLYANPAAVEAAEKLGLDRGVGGLVPPDLKERRAAGRAGGERHAVVDLTLGDAVFAVTVFFPPDQPTARLYAMDITARQQAKAALRESREDLNRAQAVAHTGSWRMNVQKNELTWSEENHRVFGIPPGSPLTYETFLSTVHPEDRDYVDQKWRGALKGEPYDIEHRIIADGQVKWVRERAELEFDQEGRLRGGFGTAQDITQRKRAEEELQRALEEAELRRQESEALLLAARAVMTHKTFADAAWEIFQGCQKTVEAPAGYVSLLNDTGDYNELVFLESGGLPCTVDPDLPMPIRGLRAEAYETGRVIYDNHFGGSDYVKLLPPGHVQLENVLFAPLKVEGQVVGLLGLSNKPGGFTDRDAHLAGGFADLAAVALVNRRTEEALRKAHAELEQQVQERTLELRLANEQLEREIDERRQAEAALDRERRRFLDVLEQMPAYVILLAPDYTVPFANREFIRRFGEAEPGQTCFEFLFGRTDPCPDCQTFRVLAEDRPQEWEWLGPDGRTYAIYDYPFTDVDGSPLILELGVDITDRKRAEEALREQEALLSLILETLPVGVWVTDKAGTIVTSNPAARQIWGGAHYVGLEKYGDYQGWWPDTGERIEAGDWALARAVTRGETSLGEVIDIQGFDGSRKTIINSAAPLLGDQGEILGAIVVNQDVTAMRKAEKTLREQARQLEAFFAHSLTPIVFLDPQFNFMRVNLAYARACERHPVEFQGRNHFELYPHAENEAIFRQVVRDKRPYVAEAKPFEFPDHPEWGVTYWDWTLTPVLNEAGEVDFLVFSLNDVTPRVRAEEARSRLIDILEATPDFVGTADPRGRVTFLNRTARRFLGLGEDEDVSRVRIRDVHPDWAANLVLQEGLRRAAREGFWRGETAMLSRDGREVPMSQVILAHADPAGQVKLFSTIARDISDLVQVQRALRESEGKLRYLSAQLMAAQETERKRLAAGLHDELGAGLLTIKLHLRALERELSPQQQALAESLEDLLAFIDGVLDNVRRLYFDLSPGNLEDLGLTGAVRQLIDQFAKYHPGIRWQVKLADLDRDFPLPAQTAIYRVVQELLNNIGKHARPSRVAIHARRRRGAASFTVEDDGRGFDVQKVLAARRGLGLAAMEERLRLLGGALEINSRENQGTRVAFTIPLAPGESR